MNERIIECIGEGLLAIVAITLSISFGWIIGTIIYRVIWGV